jgi:hypothetical protein
MILVEAPGGAISSWEYTTILMPSFNERGDHGLLAVP